MDNFEDPQKALEPTLSGEKLDFTDHPDFQVDLEQTLATPQEPAAPTNGAQAIGADPLELTVPQEDFSLPTGVEETLEAALGNTLVGEVEDAAEVNSRPTTQSRIERTDNSRFELRA